MTSDRANRANQKNAQASTGPRSAAGKRRSGQNASKHGLSVVIRTPHAADEATYLIDLLVAEFGSDPELREAAQAVVETHMHLKRVFACKRTLVQAKAPDSMIEGCAEGATQTDVTLEFLEALESLERYERRAFSQRRTAIRRLRLATKERMRPGSE